LTSNPFPERNRDIQTGLYELPRRTGEPHLYRLNHSLADALLTRAKERELEPIELRLHYSQHDGKASIIEPFLNTSGWLSVSLFTVEALDYKEDYLLFAVVTDMGQTLDDEVARRLLNLPAQVGTNVSPSDEVSKVLDSILRAREDVVQRSITE